MSKASTQKRNRITFALGVVSMLTFGGLFGVVAKNAPSTSTAAVAAVTVGQPNALTITEPTAAAVAQSSDDDGESDDDDAAASAVTVAPVAPTAAPSNSSTTTRSSTTTHTTTRAS